jgi:glutathione synthase/RimK-type ligase-like ATP-grasp enzyme
MLLGLLRILGSLGQTGRDVAYRLDLGRELGPRHALQRLRAERRTGADPDPDEGYAKIWREAAEELGAEMADLGSGFFEFHRGGRVARAWQQFTPLDDPVTLRLALDKPLVLRLAADAGVPVPDHAEFDAADPRPAIAFLERAGQPCVVKPATGSFGSGVTGAITTPSQLQRATWRASRLSRRLLIERQAAGDVYRLLFLDGRLIDVIRRLPPTVSGDGRSTIVELIDAENRRRVEHGDTRRPSLLRVDLDTLFALERAGKRLRSAPVRGSRVRVKTVVSQNSPLENETVREDVSALADEVRAAVERVGLRVAGVDVVTTDPTHSLASAGGVILEVNGAPGLHYHCEVANPEHATRVATPILEAMLA